MKWIEVKIETSNEAADAVSYFAYALGANGVQLSYAQDFEILERDADGITPSDSSFYNDGELVVTAYFPYTPEFEAVKARLHEKINCASEYLDFGNIIITSQIVDDCNWAEEWKKHYKQFNITPTIKIKPSWETVQHQDTDCTMVIEMDPGMAFGTGTHETTAMCALFIEKYMRQGFELIDIGCGSGILSIIGAKLGASEIYAVDIDEVAIKVAKDNMERNNIKQNVNYITGTLDNLIDVKADIIVANIIASVIIELSSNLKYYLKSGGIFIASGIIKDRAAEVIDIFRKNNFVDIDRNHMGEWVAIVFKCQDSL